MTFLTKTQMWNAADPPGEKTSFGKPWIMTCDVESAQPPQHPADLIRKYVLAKLEAKQHN